MIHPGLLDCPAMPLLKCTVREIPADLETPVSAFLKLRGQGARFLLESVEQEQRIGRYSFIGLGPATGFEVHGDHVRLVRGGQEEIRPCGKAPLSALRAYLARFRLDSSSRPLPSLIGGAVGYVGYDYVRFLEKLPDRNPDPLGIPICSFMIVERFVVFDHIKRRMLLVALAEREVPEELDRILEALARPLLPEIRAGKVAAEFRSNFSREDFCAAVEKAREYVHAGDILQAVLSRRIEGAISVDPFQVYRALRILNPSPYMFFLDFGGFQLVGSSPEVHVRLQGRRALCRPIAGTRGRGADSEEDRALEKDLLGDEKERAEHLMLVDLARNDLGRICRPGSVRVGDFFVVERYSHVMHIVSEVTGELEPGRDPFDLLAATFPAGTVSGAPKIRAMEIIEELEPVRRSFYAGTTGYLSLTGDMDMCITIRCMLVKGNRAVLQAGAGIVFDSDPGREWEETERKARGLLEAIRLAEAGLKLS